MSYRPTYRCSAPIAPLPRSSRSRKPSASCYLLEAGLSGPGKDPEHPMMVSRTVDQVTRPVPAPAGDLVATGCGCGDVSSTARSMVATSTPPLTAALTPSGRKMANRSSGWTR